MLERPSLALTAALVLFSSLPLAGCSSGSSVLSRPAQWITPYRPDVVQGNSVSAEQAAQLKAGLSRLQVRNLLGTPLVSSLFHADRWDYVFSLKRGSDAQPRMYRFAVFFEGDSLVKFEGDALPSESEFVGQFSPPSKGRPLPSLQASAEQLEAARATAPKPAQAEAAPPAAAPAAPLPTSYPPLEGSRP